MGFAALTSELEPLALENAEQLAKEVMSVIDEDADGKISLKEFTPICAEALRVILDEAENAQYAGDAQPTAGGNDPYLARAEEILLKELSDADLENTLMELFQSADLDNSGTLEKPEFSKCLLEADIGLTQG